MKDISQSAFLCLDPYDESFLLIRTNDEKYYLFGMEDSAELKTIFEAIENRK